MTQPNLSVAENPIWAVVSYTGDGWTVVPDSERMLPDSVQVELSSRCNLRCIYCPRRYLHSSGTRQSKDMDEAVLKACQKATYELAKKVHPRVGTLMPNVQGEPLLTPESLFEIAEWAHCLPEGWKVCIATNGTLLTEKMVDRLLASAVDDIVVSLNILEPWLYSEIHDRMLFTCAFEGTRRLIRARQGDKPTIGVQIMTLHAQRELIKSNTKLWLDVGADRVLYRELLPVHRSIRELMTRREREKYKRYLGRYDTRLTKGRTMCHYLFRVVSIDVDGYFYPCCVGPSLGPDSEMCLGNVLETSVIEAYDERVAEMRRLHIDGRWGEIPACRDCFAWEQTEVRGLIVSHT